METHRYWGWIRPGWSAARWWAEGWMEDWLRPPCPDAGPSCTPPTQQLGTRSHSGVQSQAIVYPDLFSSPSSSGMTRPSLALIVPITVGEGDYYYLSAYRYERPHRAVSILSFCYWSPVCRVLCGHDPPVLPSTGVCESLKSDVAF